jgi:hypothetical protein
MLYVTLDPEAIQVARDNWTKDMGNWGHMLLQEIDDFIAKCKEDYDNLLTEDGHNIKIYPDMKKKLAANSYVGDNLKIWWDECLRPFTPTPEKKNNVIFFEDLISDYRRFLGKRWHPRYAKVVPITIIPFLLEHAVTIHTLTNVNNSKYIMGYEWQESHPNNRHTIDGILEMQAEKIGIEGMPIGDVFAARKLDNIKGWKIGKEKLSED